MRKISAYFLFFTILLGSVQLQANSYYGPTVSSDGLYRISLAIKPSEQVSVAQTMVAIYKSNPHAFASDNMNKMYSGLLLSIPSVEEISQIDNGEAVRIVTTHNEAWSSDTPVADVVSQSPVINEKNYDNDINYTPDVAVVAEDVIAIPQVTAVVEENVVSPIDYEATFPVAEVSAYIDGKINAALQQKLLAVSTIKHKQDLAGDSDSYVNNGEIDGLKDTLGLLQGQLTAVMQRIDDLNKQKQLKYANTSSFDNKLA